MPYDLCNETYITRILAPAALSRDVPTYRTIAEALGDTLIGSFMRVPHTYRGLIDLWGDSVVAVMPSAKMTALLYLLEVGPQAYRAEYEAEKRRDCFPSRRTWLLVL